MAAPPPRPYDPHCKRYADQMKDLDFFASELFEIPMELVTGPDRSRYIREEEGTYNPANGHFTCDRCYIAIGQPAVDAKVGRWVTP